jgi:hypothetical protein
MDDCPYIVFGQNQIARHIAQQAPARSLEPLMHLDLERLTCGIKLQTSRILCVEQIAVALGHRSGGVNLDIGLSTEIMVQNVAVLREKDVKRLGVQSGQIDEKCITGNNATLPPQAIRDLRNCGQLCCSSLTRAQNLVI